MCSPSASSTVVTGCWASQSISSPGRSRFSSLATATSRRAWPSPIGEDRYRARRGRHGPRVQVVACIGAPVVCVGELGDQPGDLHRVPALWQVAGAVKHDQVTAGQLGQPPSPGHRLAAVIGAVQDAHRAPYPAAQRLGLAAGGRGAPFPLGDHRLGVGLQRPAHRVLVLLGGMRLGQLLAEEELHPLAVAAVLPPEVPVAHAPAGRRVHRVCPPPLRLRRIGIGWRDPDPRGDRDDTDGAPGVVRGQAQRPGHGVTVGDQDGPVHVSRVQHRQQVGDHLGRRVALRRARTVGSAGAPAIGGDDGEPARQGRNDPLPRPGMRDR